MSIIDPTFELLKSRDLRYSLYKKKYFDYRYKWVHNPSNFIVEDFPLHLDIELNTTCNLRCSMCFQSTHIIPPQEMDLKMVRDIIKQAGKLGVFSMKFNYRGEPLLYDNLCKVISYAKSKRIIETMINTNGTLLLPEKMYDLVNSGLDLLIVTVDGTTKEVYENIRRGADFETVLTNIMLLQSYKQLKGVNKPILRVQIVKQKKNNHQVMDFINHWRDIADEVSVVDLKDVEGDCENSTELPDWWCSQLWQRLFILADGDVVPCCRGVSGGIKKEVVLGNVKETLIKEIWNSTKLNAMRNVHKYRKSHTLAMCRRCGIRKEVIIQNGVKQ